MGRDSHPAALRPGELADERMNHHHAEIILSLITTNSSGLAYLLLSTSQIL
jgi:hypothetical protein